MWNRFLCPSVTFATTVWEKDWRQVLLDPEYLPVRQIQNHCFPFVEKLLVINNVDDVAAVKKAALRWVDAGVLTKVVVAAEIADEMLSFFQWKLSDFCNDWIYYNALGPLAAIYCCEGDYLLYLTGDVYLAEPLSWIAPALKKWRKIRSIEWPTPSGTKIIKR